MADHTCFGFYTLDYVLKGFLGKKETLNVSGLALSILRGRLIIWSNSGQNSGSQVSGAYFWVQIWLKGPFWISKVAYYVFKHRIVNCIVIIVGIALLFIFQYFGVLAPAC